MPTYSGHIGDLISFDVSNAGAITGVYFGGGLSNSFQPQPNDTAINARVPEDASWGFVTFYKRDFVNGYLMQGTGLANSGALANLENNLASSGFLSCESGSVAYENLFEAGDICNLSATGATESIASGVLYSAYNSGLCGDNIDGFVNSGYGTSTTMVDGFTAFENDSGEWLAVGSVKDTGNFVYKKALLDVSCTEAVQESTDYKFVPIPLITSFSPREGSQGGPLLIYGHIFSDVSSVSIGGVNVSYQILDNNAISGTIPSGTFDSKIELTGPSGAKAYSLDNFISLNALLDSTAAQGGMELFSGQHVERHKNDAGLISIFGSNISGLTSAYLLNENNIATNIFNHSGFSYDGSRVEVPFTGVNEGVYDLVIGNAQDSAYAYDCISIIGEPHIDYSYNEIRQTGLINEPDLYSAQTGVESFLGNKIYEFSLTGEADKLCIQFSNNTNGGSAYLELEKLLGNGKNLSNRYHIIGSGRTSPESEQHAQDMFDSGVYTKDEYNDLFDGYSYILDPCICKATSSGTSFVTHDKSFTRTTLATGSLSAGVENHPNVIATRGLCDDDFEEYKIANPKTYCTLSGYTYSYVTVGASEYLEVNLVATGYSTGENVNDIQQQITNSYPDYSLISTVHSGVLTNEQYNYDSGISFPYSTDLISDHASEPWEGILHSGINNLYPTGYGGGDNLSSGYHIINSTGLNFSASFSVTGKNESEARESLETTLATGYSQCQTGNYSASLVTIVDTITRTGITYGYC